MPKNIFEDEFFANQPFDEISAFLFLRTEARKTRTAITIEGVTFNLESGQLSHATEHLAKWFGWTYSFTRRFLQRLETAGYIEISNEYPQQVITICYDADKKAGLGTNEQMNEYSTNTKRISNEHNIENINTAEKVRIHGSKGTPKDVPLEPWVEQLVSEFGSYKVRTWFRDVTLVGNDLRVPSLYAKQYIEQFFGQSLNRAIGSRVSITIAPSDGARKS